MEHVKVGMWKLPGIKFMPSITDETVIEMDKWAKENHCGMCMGPGFWSFKNEAQRDWFILRWSDEFPKENQDG